MCCLNWILSVYKHICIQIHTHSTHTFTLALRHIHSRTLTLYMYTYTHTHTRLNNCIPSFIDYGAFSGQIIRHGIIINNANGLGESITEWLRHVLRQVYRYDKLVNIFNRSPGGRLEILINRVLSLSFVEAQWWGQLSRGPSISVSILSPGTVSV